MTQDKDQRAAFEAWYEREFERLFGPLVWDGESNAYENTDHHIMYISWLGAIEHDRQQREESCGAQNETQATKRIDKLRADPKKAEALEHARKRIKVAKSDIQPITSDPVRLEPTEAEEEAWRELEKRQ